MKVLRDFAVKGCIVFFEGWLRRSWISECFTKLQYDAAELVLVCGFAWFSRKTSIEFPKAFFHVLSTRKPDEVASDLQPLSSLSKFSDRTLTPEAVVKHQTSQEPSLNVGPYKLQTL